MKHDLRNWSIAFHKNGKRGQPIPLAEGTITIGRDASCTIRLPDASVSRVHAEVRETAEGVTIVDMKSSNGVKVNGVPRRQATLQPGDQVEVGIYKFELIASAGSAAAAAAETPAFQSAAALQQTMVGRVQLPQAPQDRQLSLLTHVCYWVTEDLDAEKLRPRLLQLLLDGFRTEEVQLYSAKLELQATASESGGKSVVKLAPFLAEKCQVLPEATIITGTELRKHQQKVGNFNYLVGPLRPPGDPSAKASFLVLIRPADWVEFTAQDRVLLQAICQLWVRGQGKVQQVQQLQKENAQLKQKAAGSVTLLGDSDAMEKLRERLRKAAGTKATVLIQGETGSGKEVVAQFLHEQSPRAAGPFVKLNCAAMPDGLIESELFGHVKGAFTDAKAHHDGKFVQANGGTLFLDEIGEMPLGVQAKLLRAIETGEIEPVGGEKPKKVDVRIVAATHRDLGKMVDSREFRQDLLFRLNVFSAKVPSLREHVDDIPLLAENFLAPFCAENGLAELTFSRDAIAALKAHAWPGNVRELRNVVQRCAIEASGLTIEAADVRAALG